MNSILVESNYFQCIQIYLDSCETEKAEVFDKYFLPVLGTKLNAISTLYNKDEMLPIQANSKWTSKSTTNFLKAVSLEDLHVGILRAGSSEDCSHVRWECKSLETVQETISKKKNSVVSIFEECDWGKPT